MGERCLVTDPDHLTSQLYPNEAYLVARIVTHQRYTVPPVDFTHWVLNLIPWQGDERVMDIGCGNGSYLEPVVERLTGRGQYLAGDLSLGMLHALPDSTPTINLNVTTLPLPASSCDVILANHMLYHVSDIDRAVAECHRILCQDRRLLAATNSQGTMAELTVLIREGYDRLGIPLTTLPNRLFESFTLENGQAILTRCFDHVERHVLYNALVFPEPTPLLAYVDSMRGLYEPGLPDNVSWDDLLRIWHKLAADYIARHGEFRINKISGAFVATKCCLA